MSCSFPNNNILLYGDMGSGKSTLCVKIVARLIKSKKYQIAYYFGSTASEMHSVYGKDKCFNSVDINVLKAIMNNQKKRNINVICVFDDVMSENFHSNRDLAGFFSTTRHYRMTCIFLVQHLRGISPLMRRATKHFYALSLTNDVVDYLSERTYYSKKQIRSLLNETVRKKKYFYYCFKNIRD